VKVLFLTHSYPRQATDPVGSFVLRLAVALRSAGVETLVVAPGAPGLPTRDSIEGVPLVRFRYSLRRWETLAYSGTMRSQVRDSWPSRASMATFVIAQALSAMRVADGFAPDLVHAHWWFPGGLAGTWLKRWRRVPLVTTLHGSDLRIAQESGVAAAMMRHVLGRSTFTTTVSRWLADGVAALAPAVRPVVAPMPVQVGLFEPGGERAADRLLFVGKLNRQKGFEYLARALGVMRHRPSVDVVVGVGSDPTEVGGLVRELGIEAQLRWHPLLAQAELAALYRSCTLLVVPSLNEGLGLVAVEAQLCEMPVVAFESGGLTDVVVAGRTGLLTPPDDHKALASALDTVLDLPDRGAAWGRAGRVHALELFAPESAAGRYADLYRSALEARS
jgi:glycosyltransferase involved in cell wall biosynthesis